MTYLQVLGVAVAEASKIGVAIAADQAVLEAGEDAPLAYYPVVGSVDGKPVYLVSHLTTVKPAS